MATVLYVDDEEAIRRAVATWLSRKGHVVHAVASLAAARDVLATQRIDGAFVDLWLGTESGLDLQHWIDENRPELATKTVFVTGDPTSGEATNEAAHRLGRPVLGKPFDLEELERWVGRWAEASQDDR